MRVLILSSNNGGGHNAAAHALRELFEAHGDVCRLEDCLSFISEDVSDAVAKSHSFVYRHAPKLFASGYRHTQRHPETFKEHHNGRRMLRLGRRNLGRTIMEDGCDAVICTHVFASLMLTDACRKYDLRLPTAVVETDYTCTPGAQSGDLDWHFIPAPSLKPELMALGVPERKIIASGIPVRNAFYTRRDKRQARRELGLEEEGRLLLMMGGSMGAGPVPQLSAALREHMDRDTRVCVVCGTNRGLRDSLTAEYRDDPRFHILGYTGDVAPLMDAADLLLTKPGGITVTEAAVKRLPMVLVESVAGCEAYNLNFFIQNGGAATADTPRALADLSLTLLRDDARRAQMSRALDAVAALNDREIIRKKLYAYSPR